MLDIAALTPSDRVQHELMVRSRDDRTTRNGDPYAVIAMGNASGQLTANVWKEQLPWLEGVRAGSVVQVIGTVELYQGKRHLKLTAPLRVVSDTAVDLAAFLPRISSDVVELWHSVDQWRGAIASRTLRHAADLFFADDAFRSVFEKCPGAPRGHHAQVGGLLQHVVEVGTIARSAAAMMHGDVDLVTVGALIHDVGKVEAYTSGAGGFDYSPAGRLLGPVALGALMLERRMRALPDGTMTEPQELELHHFILSVAGQRDWGAVVEPMTLEADLLHSADQASTRGNDFNDAVSDQELFPGDSEFSVRKSRWLDRTVWRRTSRWD